VTIAVSDLINVPKQRAVKMSKMDKLKKQLESAGLDDETIKGMIANLERKATNQTLKTVTFTKPVKMDVTKSIQVKSNGDEKPFNPGSLKFDK
jgi:SOS response regulatory protein OraA/RecX